MKKQHTYEATTEWTGSSSGGTVDYKSYSRTLAVQIPGKSPFEMSADPAFLGDPAILNPEDCMLVALSGCHMLSFLALAAIRKVQVVGYRDRATGTMVQEGFGGRFSGVVLRPEVTIAKDSDAELARELHGPAGRNCFIAASVNFPVKHEPVILTLDR